MRGWAAYGPQRVQLSVADAAAIPAPDAAFDAVFDFGVIHHVPNWRAAVAEVRRVLRPGGRFFFEEVTRQALERWAYRTFLQHPTEDRFSGAEFVAELERQRLTVNSTAYPFCGDSSRVGLPGSAVTSWLSGRFEQLSSQQSAASPDRDRACVVTVANLRLASSAIIHSRGATA